LEHLFVLSEIREELYGFVLIIGSQQDYNQEDAMPDPRPTPLHSGVPLWRAVLDRARAPALGAVHAGRGEAPSIPIMASAPALGHVVQDTLHACALFGGGPPVAGGSGINPPQSPRVDALS
jgi:hypothetical protein